MSSQGLNRYQIAAILLAAYLLTLCVAHAQNTSQFWNVKVQSNVTAKTFTAIDAANTNKFPRGDGTWQSSTASVTLTNTGDSAGIVSGSGSVWGIGTQQLTDATITNGLYSASNPAGYVTASVTNGLVKIGRAHV